MADYVRYKKDDGDKKKPLFSFRNILLILLIFFLISSMISSITYSLTPKIAVVPLSGAISTEKEVSLFGASISSREIANQLYELKDDTSVKAVLLDINSPGGSPVASEEISKAIESLKEEKPVYALINDVGASGAFWVAVSTNKIYASSMSTVGSIGVTSAGLSFEEFIEEYNITYRRLVSGQYKDLGTPYKEMTEEEKEIIQGLLDEIHSQFINHVAASRNLTYDYVENYATGEIFLGSQAKEIGFIDEIGYYPDAIADLKNITGDVVVIDYGPLPTFAESLGLSTLFQNPINTQNALELR